MKFLHLYGMVSGQWLNPAKSQFYSTADDSNHFNVQIKNLLGCNIGSFCLSYLGVPIILGAPKTQYFQLPADKIHLKLASWKSKALSMMSRIQLMN